MAQNMACHDKNTNINMTEQKATQVLSPGIDVREFTMYVANMTRWMRNELLIDSHGKLTRTRTRTLTRTLTRTRTRTITITIPLTFILALALTRTRTLILI